MAQRKAPGALRDREGMCRPISPLLSTLIKVHAQLASLLLDLTYELPLTSGARRHDSHKGLSTVPPPAPQPHLLGRLSRNRMEGGTLPCPRRAPRLRPLQSLGCGGGALGATARQSQRRPALNRRPLGGRAGALLTHRAAIGRMLDDRMVAILMIYSNTHYSQSIFTQR